MIIPPMMSGFSIETRREGVSFAKNGKYLSAFPDSKTIIARREFRKRWETFQLVEPSKVSAFSRIVSDPDVEMKRFRNAVARLQAEARVIKVQCGVGPRPQPGFLNLDIQCACPQFLMKNPDEFFKFPFAGRKWDIPNDCVDYIFHEDFIEHISQLEQIQFLAEALRVMKPGSWHRVSTPNIITAMKRYSKFEEGFEGVYAGEKNMDISQFFRHLLSKKWLS